MKKFNVLLALLAVVFLSRMAVADPEITYIDGEQKIEAEADTDPIYYDVDFLFGWQPEYEDDFSGGDEYTNAGASIYSVGDATTFSATGNVWAVGLAAATSSYSVIFEVSEDCLINLDWGSNYYGEYMAGDYNLVMFLYDVTADDEIIASTGPDSDQVELFEGHTYAVSFSVDSLSVANSYAYILGGFTAEVVPLP